jgi:hypothetical protein
MAERTQRSDERSERRDQLDPNRLRREINQMLEALTHPAFVDALRRVNSAPLESRLVEGSRLLTPEALREQGVPLPATARVSSRYFEDGLPSPIEFGDVPGGRANIVNGLNTASPGLLDRLRFENPDLFRDLIGSQLTPGLVAGCCCGGAGSVCGG